MRPRQSSLGIDTIGIGVASRIGRRFNEAEAIKPRNLPERSGVIRYFGVCFNEAEAIKPRNPA